MPRVSDEEIELGIRARSRAAERRRLDEEEAWDFALLQDLQDARAALKAILNWKKRTTEEAPLTYIERIAREVVG